MPTFVAALVLLALLASACGDDGPTDAGVVRAGAARDPGDPNAAAGAATATTALGLDILRTVTADASAGNTMLSPVSIEIALAMARAGAVGPTREEMDRVLHARDATDLDAGLDALDRALVSRAGAVTRDDGSKATIDLRIANALWGQRGMTFRDPFLTTLARSYGAGMRTVDFRADTEGARRTINTWVGEQTADKIPELLAQGALDTLTRLVLTNAVYLKAPWEHPFDESATTPSRFTRLDGSTVTTPTMRQSLEGSYATRDGYVAVSLPYAGGALAMVLLVPDAGRYRAVESNLDGAAVKATLAALAPARIDLALPTFRFRTSLSLADALARLGMPTAFSVDADFSAMTADEPLTISDVIHQSFVAVDEKGTEAAAATAVVMRATAAPAQPVRVEVDRPFLFMVVDTTTQAPLFLGRVVDPTARES